MIMISAATGQKVGKPPPPVPPRPSKTVVAEALAKSRLQHRPTATTPKTNAPARQAPPPPAPRPEIAKSKSSYSVNVTLKKPVVFERSISEEVKNYTRPVVYQSSNVKCNNNNNNSVQITRDHDEVKIVNGNSVFRNRDGVRVIGKQTCEGDDGKSRVQVFRKDSLKKEKFCEEDFIGKRVLIESGDGKRYLRKG